MAGVLAFVAAAPLAALHAPLPPRTAVHACDAPSERFARWLRLSPAAAASLHPSSSASLAGALAELWVQIAHEAEAQPRRLTLVFFPHAAPLRSLATMRALERHLRTCGECCAAFGHSLSARSLHPEDEEQAYRAPYPAFALAYRRGPLEARVRPPEQGEPAEGTSLGGEEASLGGEEASLGGGRTPLGGEEASLGGEGTPLGGGGNAQGNGGDPVDGGAAPPDSGSTPSEGGPLPPEERVAPLEARGAAEWWEPLDAGSAAAPWDEARQALEALVAAPSAARAAGVSEAAVLSQTAQWFALQFARVHRVLGARQRRTVLPAAAPAEQAYCLLWREAAFLLGEDIPSRGGGVAPSAFVHPADPVSSLLVLPSLAEVKDFKRFVSSISLALATLRLDEQLQMSAFHPRDTYQFVTADDGSRQWNMTLPYPILHLVRKAAPSK
ncbi:hypothetical protein AB1Y20_014789 [Prymnesium parvum]|uniref:Autophagy protein 5 n=1 Tax=Prymnesium parvum TaxID=97485 RepID=A0AB34ID37_PRYPA